MTTPPVPTAIDQVVAFAESRFAAIDLTGLVAFTLRWLQERHIATTFENIVVASFKMFPSKFSLEGFPDYPDAARVGRTLLQLGPKYRNWARGSVQKGFVLTESGLQKVGRVEAELGAASNGVRQPATRRPAPRTMDLGKELQAMGESALFQNWRAGKMDEGGALDLLNMLGAYAYTPPRALRDRVAVLENAATHLGRADLVEFLRAVRRTFAASFRDS